jgi:nucleoside-triphosphatase THEP1
MINIITGKINSYKTTKIKKIFDDQKKGDGFISIKTMKDNNVLYYEFERLQTKRKQIGIIHTLHYPNHFTHYEQLGPYVFDLDYLQEIKQVIDELIAQKIEPIFLDEIGLLEVNKLYFYPILKKIVESELDAYITVRDSLVEPMIDLLGIQNYTIIE